MNNTDKEFFAHPESICESKNIGRGTTVWAFAHILPGAVVGSDCNLCDHTFIENDVVIGDRVTIKCGVQLWDGLRVEDDVFIGPNVTFTNDRFPRSKQYQQQVEATTIREGASIGANATLLPGITIGRNAMIGAGSVVTRSVPPNAVVMGNPGQIVDYVNSSALDERSQESGSSGYSGQTTVSGVTLHELPLVKDMRGNLSVGEFENDVPFKVERYFVVFDVPSFKTRGEHAHRECQQFLVCVKGNISVVADDGTSRQEFLLNRPNLAVYLPPLVWGIQYKASADAVLLVFASQHYDPDDYIRDYDEFLRLVKQQPNSATV